MQALRAPTEIPAEALDARPESTFKPIQAWAWAGGVILAFQLYSTISSRFGEGVDETCWAGPKRTTRSISSGAARSVRSPLWS